MRPDGGSHLEVTHCAGGRLGRLHGGWRRKRAHGGLAGRSHNLVLPVEAVMAQLGHPGVKYVLRFDLWRSKIPCNSCDYLFIYGGSCNNNVDAASCWRYLQVIDVLLCVQVDTTGPLLDGHDGQAHVDAAMEFSLLDLWQMSETSLMR